HRDGRRLRRPGTGAGDAAVRLARDRDRKRPTACRREDPDVGAALLELFQDEGIEVLLGTEIRRVEGRSAESIRIHAKDGQGKRIVEGTDLLVATGRTPNTDGIGLEQAGVER